MFRFSASRMSEEKDGSVIRMALHRTPICCNFLEASAHSFKLIGIQGTRLDLMNTRATTTTIVVGLIATTTTQL
jgi:hypothetical protein